MSENNCIHDWEGFVRELARQMAQGQSLTQLSEQYGGATVAWHGVVRECNPDDEYAPGVQLDMPLVEAQLGGDKILMANYVFLNIEDSAKGKWHVVSKGKRVSFRANLQKQKTSVFPVIDVDEFPGDPKIVLSLAIENAVPQEESSASG